MWKCLKSGVLSAEHQNKPGPLLHVLSLSLSMGKEGGGDEVNVPFAFIVHFGRADICRPILFGSSNLEAIMPDYVPQHFLLFTVSWTLTLPLFAALKRGKKQQQHGLNKDGISRIWIIDAEYYKKKSFTGKISLGSQTHVFLLHFHAVYHSFVLL